MSIRVTGSTTHALGAILAVVLAVLLLERSSFAQATWYVNPSATGTGGGDSWENAFTSLQPALAASGDADSIWIRGGTYKPTTGTDRSATFTVAANVTLYGGFAGTEDELHERDILANPTILSGDLNGDDTSGFGNRSDNSHHVATVANVGDFAVLDGLIIRGGNADGTSATDRVGAGVFIIDSTGGVAVRAWIQGHSRLEDCTALVAGAAISGATYEGTPTSELDYYAPGAVLRDVVATGNRSGGASLTNYQGGGAASLGYLRATRTRFDENQCSNCNGGAVSLEFRAEFGIPDPEDWSVLVNVEFVDNAADDGTRLVGGGLAGAFGVTLANCLFARNVVGYDADIGRGFGGGMYVEDGAEIVNCTFAENLAYNDSTIGTWPPGLGGGLQFGDVPGLARVRNSVFWGNLVHNGDDFSDSQVAQTTVTPAGTLSTSLIAFSLVQNYVPPGPDYRILGDNVVLHDPLFADPASDNYLHRSIHITNYGDDGSLPDDVNDLDDDSDTSEALPLDLPLRERVRGTAVDVGAYEWCVGDLNGDGVVEGADLGLILGLYDECSSAQPCLGDLTGDEQVDSADLGILLGNWECGFGSSLLFGDPVETLLSALGLESVEELWELLLDLGPEEGAELVAGLM